jgi:hypothetical protein
VPLLLLLILLLILMLMLMQPPPLLLLLLLCCSGGCCVGHIKANGACVNATDPVLGCKNDEVAGPAGCVTCERRMPGSVSGCGCTMMCASR